MNHVMYPIGVIHTPFNFKDDTPIQPTRSDAAGQVELYPEYADGLKDIEGISHIILIYIFHQSTGYSLEVKPFLDTKLRGLFATRYPARPNQIGLSIVRLINVNKNILHIMGVDMLDKTPLLDIKPYVPDFDIRDGASIGWYDRRSIK